MGTAGTRQKPPRQFGPATADSTSWAQHRSIARRIVLKATEDRLCFGALEPFGKGSSAFGIWGVHEHGSVVNQRIRIKRLAANGQRNIGMVGLHILAAQVDLRRQRDVGEV